MLDFDAEEAPTIRLRRAKSECAKIGFALEYLNTNFNTYKKKRK